MIDISKLYCDENQSADSLRYGEKSSEADTEKNEALRHKIWKSARERRPVTVWNSTRSCNLRCVHCYTDSENMKYSGELTTEEAKQMILDVAEFKIPALLISGGEPLVREDIFELANFCRESGVRPVLSTNGTLITKEVAQKIKEVGFIYVGISLDGIEEVNDEFRGKEGAYKEAMQGMRNCVEVGQKVGLRMTLTKRNYEDLHKIFDFIEREKIDRACFYHLVYSGRGVTSDDLTHEETRKALDIIMERTKDFSDRGLKKDILTVDNHVDGVYTYLKLLQEGRQDLAEKVHKRISWNGGGNFSSGVGFGCIDYKGYVHADQFWHHYSFGNVRDRKFGDIWMDESNPIMKGLKDRKSVIKGRCSKCQFVNMCGGALRVRADQFYGDPWAPDPACYLTDEEIGLTPEQSEECRREEFEWRKAVEETIKKGLPIGTAALEVASRQVELISGR